MRDANDCSSADTKSVGQNKTEKLGGYDYRLVCSLPDGSDDLFCKICHSLSRNPQLSNCCGGTFCKSCIDDLSKSDHEFLTITCPACCSSEFSLGRNKQIDRAIRSLRVYCTNEQEGCKWEGEIYDIVAHVDYCQYENVECENNGCDSTVQRQHLKSHMDADCPYRDVKCQYCYLGGKHWFIENEHKEECQNFPLPCPNGCEIEGVARQDVNKHRSLDCPLEMIKCEYYDMGCERKVARRDIKDHSRENVEQHLSMVKCELASTEKQLVQAQEDAAIVEKTLDRAHADLKKLEQWVSDAQTQEQENVKRLEIQIYKSICQLHKNCNPWMLKLNALAAIAASGEQVVPVVLKVTNFSKIKREKKGWDSGDFYSHNEECKMRLSVHPGINCNAKDAYLSVQLSLMCNDSKLSVQGTIKLLNQTGDQEHHCVIVDSCDFTNAWVFSEWKDSFFISHSSLNAVSNTCNFVKDDCLFFEVCVTVQSTNMKPQLSSSSLFSDSREGTGTKDIFSSPRVRISKESMFMAS